MRHVLRGVPGDVGDASWQHQSEALSTAIVVDSLLGWCFTGTMNGPGIVSLPPSAESSPGTHQARLIEVARRLAPVLRALSDETRLAILLALAQSPRSVRELCEVTGLAQSLGSHHLAPLREAGVVTVTPVGRSNRYSLCCQALAEPVRFLSTLAAARPECTPAVPGDAAAQD